MSPNNKTVKHFTLNGHKYVVTETEKGHCVRKNGIYMCNKEVRALIKELRGGVIVYLEGTDASKDKLPKRLAYDEFKEFIDNIEIADDDKSNYPPYFPIMKIVDSDGKDILFRLEKTLASGSFGITGIMGSSDKSDTRKFILKRFFDKPMDTKLTNAPFEQIIKGRDKEIENVNKLCEIDKQTKLFKTIGTYARTIATPDNISKYVLMELAQGDLFDYNDIYNFDKNTCDCIKIIYAMFIEIKAIYEKTGLLYSDTKLENFLYTHDNNGDFYVIMADYGGLSKENEVPFYILKDESGNYIKNAQGLIQIEYTGLATTYKPLNVKVYEWKNNWKNVAYSLGCSLIVLLYNKHQSSYDILQSKEYFVEIFRMAKSENINIYNLLVSLLGQNENGYLQSDKEVTSVSINEDIMTAIVNEKCQLFKPSSSTSKITSPTPSSKSLLTSGLTQVIKKIRSLKTSSR
jgi:hypothetical protein